ncbi:MAG: regulatory signaling modulator protein AmpE [Gammaproteobacteria bacterium]|jgi:AmpE protein
MNFLALFVGLGIERLLTHLFRLREFHWLDPLFDWVIKNQRIVQPNLAVAVAAIPLILVVLPVGLVEANLHSQIAVAPQFIFAVIVLLFCLGPRDLGEEVNAYCKAIEAQDAEEIRSICIELLEREPHPEETVPDIEQAIYAQANNRVFGVVFWFVMLGPTGAWMFRSIDLMQRRAVAHIRTNELLMSDGEFSQVAEAVLLLHRLIAWVPARLLAIGYMLAGSYDGALDAWRSVRIVPSRLFPGSNDQLLGAVGKGAAPADQGGLIERCRKARDLVGRTLWMIWCPILALMTLVDMLF